MNDVIDAAYAKNNEVYAINAEIAIDTYNEVSSNLYMRKAIDTLIINKYFDYDNSDSMTQTENDEVIYSSILISQLK
jgi:homospermidine synthase